MSISESALKSSLKVATNSQQGLQSENKDLAEQLLHIEQAYDSLELQLSDQQSNAEEFHSNLSSLRSKCMILETEKASLQNEVVSTTNQLDNVMRSNDALESMSRELKNQLAGANAKSAQLQEKLSLATKRLDLADRKSRDAEGMIVATANKNEALRQELGAAHDVIRRRTEMIFRPLETAKLVIKIRAKVIAPDLDLDLYVQDPRDNVCYWKQPRLKTWDSEYAALVSSQDVFDARVGESELNDEDVTEEIYYAGRALSGDRKNPYLVFCMMREIGDHQEVTQIEQVVEWEIQFEGQRASGNETLTTTGLVQATESLTTFPGLVPLAAFVVSDSGVLQVLPDGGIPELFRGWSRQQQSRDAINFRTLRDPEFPLKK